MEFPEDILVRPAKESCTIYSQAHRFLHHLMTYTKATKTGTSIKGPTVAANASWLPAPYTATTTAIASSKLLLAAVNDCVQLILYPKPMHHITHAVLVKTTRKYTTSGAHTRRTDVICSTTCRPCEPKSTMMV